jgi:SAM-dependent methyltransferase
MTTEEKIYYHDKNVHHNLTSPEFIIPLITNKIKVNSVLDVGCGLGGWLSVFSKNNINDIVGIDGAHVVKTDLLIPADKFVTHDLTHEINLNRKFDLAVCLEVAEHLPETSANAIVKTLTNHADIILFSSAIIGQEGQNHINEQWFSYWQTKFNALGYEFYDEVRPAIWNNKNIDWWYKQNVFIVSKATVPTLTTNKQLLCGYHPDWYEKNAVSLTKLENGEYSIKALFGFLISAIKRKVLGVKTNDDRFKQ